MINEEPSKVAIAGDWHSNSFWATSAIHQICMRLKSEETKFILHAGDYGIWPHREFFLEEVNAALEKEDAWLYFTEGNHDWHTRLTKLFKIQLPGFKPGDPIPVAVTVASRIKWMPRGYRWEWHNRKWLAVGGATSVDQLALTEGVNWWREEEITDEEEARLIASGPADVMICHDAPTAAPLTLMNPPPRLWQPMIPQAEKHRERLQRICEAVKPRDFFHGHYHQSNRALVKASWGPCTFTALDMNGTQRNWGILDTETMGFEW
jgi:Calcineurin-like phosphoesterase